MQSFLVRASLKDSGLAYAYVYFEKLVLKVMIYISSCQNVVSKGNRRLVAGVCLLLATKGKKREFEEY